MRFVTPTQMREMDRQTIETIGIPGIVLMERAALGACDVMEVYFDQLERIAIVCGPGNNGGDGLAMARILAERGYHAVVFLLSPPSAFKRDALINLNVAQQLGLSIHDVSGATKSQIEDELLRHGHFDVWVDAIFGTGLTRPVAGIHHAIIDFLNGQDQVFSVDIPSGIDGANGQILGAAVHADATATFGRPKVGNVVSPGVSHNGELFTVPIGIPASIVQAVGTAGELLTAPRLLSARPRDFHKGQAGRFLCVGGRAGKTGAILMTAHAAMKSGAGLLVVATDSTSSSAIAPALNEVMSASVFRPAKSGDDQLDYAEFTTQIAWADVIAFGPGLGLGTAASEALDLVLQSNKALVLDADGLNALPTGTQLPSRCIATPHPGEMARLRQCSVGAVLADPLTHAIEFSKQTGAVVVLKGAATIIAAPDGRIAVNSSGNPGMATAGMGDALTGLAAVMLHEVTDPFDAACNAVFLHGCAGDVASLAVGERSLLVSDLIAALPDVLKDIEC